MVTRDQMVGPWQVPVADVAVTSSALDSFTGEAMGMGERTPAALLDAPASGRLAIGEVVTNMAAARIGALSDIRLSANWMAAAGHPGEDARLYETVRAVGMETAPALGLTIPVGKDSMSMHTRWTAAAPDGNGESGHTPQAHQVTAPLSLIVSGFAPVVDVRDTLTPQLQGDQGASDLILLDLGGGKNRLGASAFAQVTGQLGDEPADLDDPERLKGFFSAIQQLNQAGLLLAYHDRSDGGLLATVAEMAFAGHLGVDIHLDALANSAADLPGVLFTEELGAVLQIRRDHREQVLQIVQHRGLADYCQLLGAPNERDEIAFHWQGKKLLAEKRVVWQRLWSETSYRLQALRDNSACAQEEFDALLDTADPGLQVKLSFSPDASPQAQAPAVARGVAPEVAILREQGVNGQVEMAAAFHQAGLVAVDVHMSDILSGRVDLARFHGLVACGGFSYGDVLGAGQGWAKSILFNERGRRQFSDFFSRDNNFVLGVCNGCQMLAGLREMIPGTAHWPRFVKNRSEQFEARLVMVEVLESPSVLLQGMAGSWLPVAVAHGEGQARFQSREQLRAALDSRLVSLRYLDHYGRPTEGYPFNPNGSPHGVTGLCNTDGRVTIMMPHPERVFRVVQHSWHPRSCHTRFCNSGGSKDEAPWMRMFRQARVWLDQC
jgi:phosphoribosylformylglycinamidine synthase